MNKKKLILLSTVLILNFQPAWGGSSDDEDQGSPTFLRSSKKTEEKKEETKKGFFQWAKDGIGNVLHNTKSVEKQKKIPAYDIMRVGTGGYIEKTNDKLELETHRKFFENVEKKYPSAKPIMRKEWNESFAQVLKEDNENCGHIKNKIIKGVDGVVEIIKKVGGTILIYESGKKLFLPN